MVNQLLNELLQFMGAIYGFAKPIIVIELLMFIVVGQAMSTKASTQDLGRAVLCYLLEGLGVFLMMIGAMPTVMAAIGPHSFTPDLYLALMIVFATGGVLFLWVDQHLRTMPADATAIPGMIYNALIKTIGYLFIVFSAITIAMAIASESTRTEGWWVVPMVTLLFGIVICVLTLPDVKETLWTGKKKKALARKKK